MTADAARRFLGAATEPMCLSYRYRPNGDIVFARDPARRDLRLVALASVAALAAGCSDIAPVQTPVTEPIPRPLPMPEPLVMPSAQLAGTLPDPDTRIAPKIDCTLANQLSALGGYGYVVPAECRERADAGDEPTGTPTAARDVNRRRPP